MSEYIQIYNQGCKGFGVMFCYVVCNLLFEKKSGVHLYGQNQNGLSSTAII